MNDSLRLLAVALTIAGTGCGRRDPGPPGPDLREPVERVACIFRDGGEIRCERCPTGFICATPISCGPPVRLDDGGFDESCQDWGNETATGECRPFCADDSDCGAGETCRLESTPHCTDVIEELRFCARDQPTN